MIVLRTADGFADMETVRILMREYAAHLAANPGGAAGICIENFNAELAALPGAYLLLLLAEVDGDAAGCVALKPIDRDGEHACELKRLWVRHRFRGLGLGKGLVGAAIEYAATTYSAIYLDTVPAAMPEANQLYASMGFERIERYNSNPVADVVFFRRVLSSKSAAL